jgi:hypothetical protein
MIRFTTRHSTIFLIGFALLAFATPTVHGQGRSMRMRPMMPPRQMPLNPSGMMRTQSSFSPRQFDRFEDRLERRFAFDPFLRSRFLSDPFMRREFFSNSFLRRELLSDPFLRRELLSDPFLRMRLGFGPFLGVGVLGF